MLYGNVTYVPRSLYARREEMLLKHADLVAGNGGSVVSLNDILEASLTTQISGRPNWKRLDAHRYAENLKTVVIVNEGAGDAVALLGVIRLVWYLSQNHVLGKEQALKIVVDAGTGTTAIGLALGAICLGLPWEVHAVMLADNIEGYRRQEETLISEFQRCCAFPISELVSTKSSGRLVKWLDRSCPRKFGNVLAGEVNLCQQITQQTGVLVDPMYTLAGWELATQLCQQEGKGGVKVVMLHTGGTLAMFGLAQRVL
ncbi:D-cysteine desulfhydrase [Bertholletia excelsa]